MMHSARACVALLVLAVLLGRVLDATTGQPLIGVRISVAGPQHAWALTDRQGRYRLSGLRPGTYHVTLVSSDVPAQHRTVVVRGTSTVLDVRACSTTLDYSCGAPTMHGGPGGSGA
jgi:protocatechuate 3,4-dioxygenase beta subunit